MIGVCRRLSLALLLVIVALAPAYAQLGDGETSPLHPTANSVHNLSVTWGGDNPPDTEPWPTEELGINRLYTDSPWKKNPNYYFLQPDPDGTIYNEPHQTVDVIENEYCVVKADGSIVLSRPAVGIKGVWADRWQRKNLWHDDTFTPGDTITFSDPSRVRPDQVVFVSYYVPGRSMVLLDRHPLPSEITVYRYPAEPGFGTIAINPEIIKLDPDTGNLRNNGDPWNNLLGIWDNEALKGMSILDRVDRVTGLCYLSRSVPSTTRYVYVAVSTYAIDYVDMLDGTGPDLPADYDPDTGEVVLKTSAAADGQDVLVTYRPLGRTKITMALVPIVDVSGVYTSKENDTNYLGQPQFDAATGRITLGRALPWNTRSVYVEYDAVDMEDVTPEKTWSWREGDHAHPIVRESDDLNQRYCTLQPDPTSTMSATSSHPGLYHGVGEKLTESSIPRIEPSKTALANLISGRLVSQGWIPQHEADEDNEIPAQPYDIIVTSREPVLIAEVWVADEEGEVTNWGGSCDVAMELNSGQYVIIVDPDNALPEGARILSVSYYTAGKYYVFGYGPAPMPATVHAINLNGYAQARSNLLRINPRLLDMDEDTAGWRAKALSQDITEGYNILGIFDNLQLQGWNYWTPGPGMVEGDASGAAVLKLNTVPHTTVNTLYIKVSTYAVDSVVELNDPTENNLYPGRFTDDLPDGAMWAEGNDGHETAFYEPDVVVSYPMRGDEDPEYLHLVKVHLREPLSTDGAQVRMTHRALSQSSITPARGPVMACPVLTITEFDDNGAPIDRELNDLLQNDPPVFNLALEAEDPNELFQHGTRMLKEIKYHAMPCIMGLYTHATWAEGLRRFGDVTDDHRNVQPMYLAEPGLYRLAVSAGLNMFNRKQQPRYDLFDASDICLLRDPRGNPMDVAPLLVAEMDGSAAERSWSYVAATHPEPVGQEPIISTAGPVTATVHDSEPSGGVSWAGQMMGRDYLTNYPGEGWPIQFTGPDPLIAVSPSPIVPLAMTPDDGSSSTTFDFRVRYWNLDNLPPKPWMPAWCDEFDPSAGRPQVRETGVVLYLDLADVFDLGQEHRHESYRPHFMRKENPADEDYAGGVTYLYRLQPAASPWINGMNLQIPSGWNGNDYISLMIGNYHYFFACSDDSLTFENDTDYALYFQYFGDTDDPWTEWGNVTPLYRAPYRSSTGLDPHLPRNVIDEEGRPFMPRNLGRRYSSFGDEVDEPRDWQLYVDRYDRVPGHFEILNELQYPWKSTEHPQVSLALSGYGVSPVEGYGRFYGTISPFYRMANPAIETAWDEDGFGLMGTRTETTGATNSTMLTFNVKFYQRDSRAPLWIKTFVGGSALKVIDPQQAMKPENGGFVGYTMQPSAVQSTPGQSQKAPYNYRLGVDYEVKMQLPSGPHTYYFMAYDGIATAIWPARPENWQYGGMTYGDIWIPDSVGDCPEGYDNNYCPGPYINTPCILSDSSVNPATGIEGQQYVFRVLYTDKDSIDESLFEPDPSLPKGQRPYKAKIYIDTGTEKGILAFDMHKEDPFDNDYTDGVWYVLNTASLEDFSLAKGVRKYRFEFTDDWGRVTDLNDVVRGETTYYPSSGGWIDGPVIGTQTKPTLRFGKADSLDGTANSATMWRFTVEYKDINNDPPKFVTLYIGSLNEDGQSITWDSGHHMTQSNPGDKTYYDGAEFFFETRLPGADNVGDLALTYYYAFEASDGVNLATWVPEDYPDVNARSESAGCLLKDPLTTDDYTVYQSTKVALVGTLQNQPTNAGILTDPVAHLYLRGDMSRPVTLCREDTYVVKGYSLGSPTSCTRLDAVDAAFAPPMTEIEGVYINPDLSGEDYYHLDDGTSGVYAGGAITLARPLPHGTTWVWIEYKHTREHRYAVDGTLVDPKDRFVAYRTTPIDPNNAPEIHEVVQVFGAATDYFNAPDGTPGSYDPATGIIQLQQPVVAGDEDLTIVYRLPVYTLNKWTGQFTFDKVQDPRDLFRADYFFATRMSTGIGWNTPPMLSNPKLTPKVGTSSTDFNYRVDYRDIDGPNGQAPSYVRVVIDGVEHNMTPVVTGTPSYRERVTFTYTTKLSSGAHNYYFTASDGADQVTLPEADPLTGNVTPYLGPWINNPPALSSPMAAPNPSPGSISTIQPVTYSVVFSDPDNDGPITYMPFINDATAAPAIRAMALPTPLLYVDNKLEAMNVGIVDSLVVDAAQPGKYRSIRVLDSKGAMASMTADQFAGKLLQFQSGPLNGRVYLIANNTETDLKLMIDDLMEDGLEPGAIFTIGVLRMYIRTNEKPNYAAGVAYDLTVPQLAEGVHAFHFKAASTMSPPPWVGAPYDTMTQSAWVVAPLSGEVTGPSVVPQPPSSNHAPILSLMGDSPVSPASGKPSDSFEFAVSYMDADGNPPHYHDGVLGYIRVVFNDGAYAADLTPEVPEDEWNSDWYKEFKRFTVTTDGLPEGVHKFHFEASDGWTKVRLPLAAQGGDPGVNDFVVSVNSRARLTEMQVNPPAGDSNTTFAISVKYSHQNGQPPFKTTVGGVQRDEVWVELNGNTANRIYLTRDAASGTNYVTGVVFRTNKGGLTPGSYTTVFRAKDALGEITTVAGPTFTVTANQNAPALANQKVFNTGKPSLINADASGGTSAVFRYEVEYSDPDGDVPIVVHNGATIEGIRLYVDGVFDTVVTQRSPSALLTNGQPDYTKPVTYYCTKIASSMTAGEHNYYFEAKDGVSVDAHTVRTPTTPGPVILSATIQMVRAVVVGSDLVDRDPYLGETVRITGVLTASSAKPIAGGQRFNIRVTRPDGTYTTSTVTGAAAESGAVKLNQFTFDLEAPTINRDWTITATWAGNSDYTTSVSSDLRVTVHGPTRVVATQDITQPATSTPVVDMVTSPLVSPNGDVGTLYGFDFARLSQIVRWDPTQRTYLWYGSTYFPTLAAGNAVWILPGTSLVPESINSSLPLSFWPSPVDPNDPAQAVSASKQYRLLKPFGRLANQTADREIQLKQGWNQIGSAFLAPTEIGNARISFQGRTVSIDEAAASGWVRNYAWMWDPVAQKYQLISATRPDRYKSTFDPWRGYWIRAFADCTLVLAAPGRSAASVSALSAEIDGNTRSTTALTPLDEPPAAPIGADH